jgi:hypothetical protein
LQARRISGLDVYPRGKSAMIYYDADENLELALARLRGRLVSDEVVWVRFAAAPPSELQKLLQQFIDRFGAAPRLNQAG